MTTRVSVTMVEIGRYNKRYIMDDRVFLM